MTREPESQRIIDRYERRRADRTDDWFGYRDTTHLLRIQERHRVMLGLLARSGRRNFSGLAIADLGCGDGNLLRSFVDWGARPERMAGIELRPDAVERARVATHPATEIICGSAEDLPWETDSIDLACLSTVFSSIFDEEMKRTIVDELRRVLKPGGAVCWYDFFRNNPSNTDVRGVGSDEIRQLFGGFEITLRRVTLAPPLARRIPGWLLPVVYPLLASFPMLRTHYLGIFELVE